MAAPEFVFVVHLSGRERVQDHQVLGEVAASVFHQLGCDGSAATDLVDQLNAAVSRSLGDSSELDVRFHAHAGACDVAVLVHDREVWRTTFCLP